jgi:hypothetical protein
MDRVVPSGFVAGVSWLPSDATIRLQPPRRLGAIWRRKFPTIATSSVMAIIRDVIGEAFHPRDCRTLEIV